MPKILFIESKSGNLHIFSQFRLPRPETLILGTMMKRRDWQVKIIVERHQKIDFGLYGDYDLAAISTITVTAQMAYNIADRFREMQVPVILVGPHATYFAEEALRHADFVIRGEGEIPLQALINAWEGDRDFSKVPSLSYKTIDNQLVAFESQMNRTQSEIRVIHNPVAVLPDNLDLLPFPDLSLINIDPGSAGGNPLIPVQTSRSCCFDCSLSSITGNFGTRYRSIDNIIEELWLYNYRKNCIFFYDDNITANQQRARALLKAMIREKFVFKWSAQARLNIANDEELVHLMKQAGCHTVFIGLESVNPSSLNSMKKHQTVDDIVKAIKVLRRCRIHVQFHCCSLYDAHQVVFKPKELSLFDLQHARVFSHDKFYSFSEIVKRLMPGHWLKAGIARYVRRLNRKRKKKNRIFLSVAAQPNTDREANRNIDYKQSVSFDEQAQAGL